MAITILWKIRQAEKDTILIKENLDEILTPDIDINPCRGLIADAVQVSAVDTAVQASVLILHPINLKHAVISQGLGACWTGY